MQEPDTKGNENRSTDISKHKREGKTLLPPFRQLQMSPSSWKDDRMPEMLWAVLLIGNIKREEALDTFRKVADLVSRNSELSDITHSGIAAWSKESRIILINLLKKSHPEAQKILQSLAIFSDLPGYLAKGVSATLRHQSQEATDCRWIKFLCEIHGGKMKFSSSIGGKF